MESNFWLSVYGKPYDPRPMIERWLAGGTHAAISELWDQLTHQGTVNTASYAAACEIVRLIEEMPLPDWNAYALLASIEQARISGNGPPLPKQLEINYHRAWVELLPTALCHLQSVNDDLTVRGIIAVIAHIKGQHSLGALALCTEDERQEMLNA